MILLCECVSAHGHFCNQTDHILKARNNHVYVCVCVRVYVCIVNDQTHGHTHMCAMCIAHGRGQCQCHIQEKSAGNLLTKFYYPTIICHCTRILKWKVEHVSSSHTMKKQTKKKAQTESDVYNVMNLIKRFESEIFFGAFNSYS